MKHSCTWINHSDFTQRDTMYCGKPVGWTMVKDDDGNRVRQYNTLCDEHQKIWAEWKCKDCGLHDCEGDCLDAVEQEANGEP